MNYWWLVVNPDEWKFSNVEVGQEEVFFWKTVGGKAKVFFSAAKHGDPVIGYESGHQKIVALCEIAEKELVKNDPDPNKNGLYIKKTKDLKIPLDYNDFKKRPQLKDMAFIKNPMGGTLFPLTLGEYTFLNKLIDQRQNGEGDFASHQDDKEIPAQDTLKECINLLQSNGNLVLTGAPGTGKTYLAKQIVIHWMFNKKNEDELTDDERKIFREHYDFVQLHPSYDYTDFVEGLRPTREDVGFKLEDGIFKKFCKRAAVQDELPYIFVIDEINRGEISKIFGELFFSIDPDYRGEKGKVKTQYSNLIEDDDPFKDGFYIPNNVYIIGTMNDIDRSVESFDFAMRRRFVWKEVTAEESAVNMQLKEDVSEEACNKMKSLNDEISKIEELGGHYQIGAAYFLKLKDIDNDYRRLWTLHLKPLLWEYVRALPEPQKVLDRLEQAYNLENTTNENSA